MTYTYRYPLLLTGTIDPRKYDGEVKDVKERLNKYENAITKYICETPFNPIVFAENSDYPFDAAKFESLAEKNGKKFELVRGTVCKEQVKKHGKGYGDAFLIYEGLNNSFLLKHVDIFYKMTGRIFLKNSYKIVRTRDKHRNEFICYDGMGWCMTYIFKSNRDDYLNILGDVYRECDDKSTRDNEICFWLRLQKSTADIGTFSVFPDIEGNMGETSIPYTRSQVERSLRTWMSKLGIFTMNSRSSRLFWKIYQNVTGRKPYVTVSNNQVTSEKRMT